MSVVAFVLVVPGKSGTPITKTEMTKAEHFVQGDSSGGGAKKTF